MSLTMKCAKMCLRRAKVDKNNFNDLLEFVTTSTEVSKLILLLDDNPFTNEVDLAERLTTALLERITFLNREQLPEIKNDFSQLCLRYEASVPDSDNKALLYEALEALLDATTHENCSDDIKYMLMFLGNCGEFPNELLPKMLDLAERLSKEEISDIELNS